MDEIKKTGEVYSFLWKKVRNGSAPKTYHFAEIQELVLEPIVRGKIGIDVGTGCGYDTYYMAKNNPGVRIVGLDLSEGIHTAKRISAGLQNAFFLQGSVLELPLKDNVFDFAYSFGVLHHTPDPSRGLREIARVIKTGAPVFIYLYEDHSQNPIKHEIIRAVSFVRRITTNIHPFFLYFLSFLFSPLAVIFFSYPSWIMRRFRATARIADKMPFNFGTHPFSVAGDLYDRFSAPIEYRFSKSGMRELFAQIGFTDIKIGRLKSKAGWVAWGFKAR
ncbi:MAG: class I SAM-dependent methyltransferase [Candidatus Omnitrophota bacterium]